MAGNWLDIAGSVGRGVTEGAEDLRKSDEAAMRKKEFAALQKQRKRVEDEQAKDDAQTARVAKVRPPGKYVDETAVPRGQETAAGFTGPPSGVERKDVNVTEGDYNRELANAVSQRGNTAAITLASQLRTNAYTAEQAARTAEMQKAQSVFMQAGRLSAVGNDDAAMELLAKEANGHALMGGSQIVIQKVNGVTHAGVQAPGGQWVQPLQPVTPQTVQAMIDKGTEMLSPELRMAGRKLGIDEKTAESGRISANAARDNALAHGKLVDFQTGEYGQAQIAAMKARADYERAIGSAAHLGPTIQGTDPTTGQAVYGAIDLRNKKMVRFDMGPNFVPSKLPQQLTDVQREAFKAEIADHKAQVEAGAFKSPIEAQAAFQTILKRYGGDQVGGTDFITAARAQDPNKIEAPKNTPAEKKQMAGEDKQAKAAQAEKEKRFTRSLARGGWQYSPVARGGGGKTKEEWAALDAKEGRQ